MINLNWRHTADIRRTIATHLPQQSANWTSFFSPPLIFLTHTFLSHKHTLNRCPVGLNFFLSFPLIFDAPCIALIMDLAAAQTSAVLNTFECLKRQTHHSGARGLAAEGISMHTIPLSYMRYIRDFTRGRGQSLVYPFHLLSLGQREDIFHSPGTCSFSAQGLCVEGEKVPARWMHFKLARKCCGMRRQNRGKNEKRPRSAVASHGCRQWWDLSRLPLAVKKVKGRIYTILNPKFYPFAFLNFCWMLAEHSWKHKKMNRRRAPSYSVDF